MSLLVYSTVSGVNCVLFEARASQLSVPLTARGLSSIPTRFFSSFSGWYGSPFTVNVLFPSGSPASAWAMETSVATDILP